MKLKYSSIKFFVAITLDVEVWEYHYLEMIKRLQSHPESKKPGWAYISNESAGYLLRKDPRTVQRAKERLYTKALIDRDKYTGHCRVTKITWEAMELDKVTPEMISALSEQDRKEVLAALYPDRGDKMPPQSRQNAAPRGGKMPPNSNTDNEFDNWGWDHITDMFQLKNEICGLRIPRESIEARQTIQRLAAQFYDKKWFIEQFKFCVDGIKIHQSIEDIVNGWILNGHWTVVGTFEINKISGWLKTTGKSFNQPNNRSNGKARFQDDIV